MSITWKERYIKFGKIDLSELGYEKMSEMERQMQDIASAPDIKKDVIFAVYYQGDYQNYIIFLFEGYAYKKINDNNSIIVLPLSIN